MIAKGKFEINMTPQSDEVPAGRFMLNKTYEGDMIGKASGQMISKRIEGGAAIYFAIEEFAGTVGGKKGAFTLAHKGFMNEETQTLEIAILEGSGTEDLANINGTLNINQSDGSHFYELNYQL
ncbi:DUF3224 domain-containing protein [Ekhidna sp.]|uniref:DUF3224 domain-containing protein n=1 Tax=Ekhidna sp. TaxID=2608089 RepID=UPI003BAC6E75